MTKRYTLYYDDWYPLVSDNDSVMSPEYIVESLNEKDEEIARLKADNEWVSVEDRLPEKDTDVIAIGTWQGEINGVGAENTMSIVCFNGSWQLDSDTYTTELIDVTDWKPLPEPPTGDKP